MIYFEIVFNLVAKLQIGFLNDLLESACPTVVVEHTNHWNVGDNGQYFYFSVESMDAMVGNMEWNDKEFDIVQQGSHHWSGRVIVWGDHASGAHGRRVSDAGGRDQPGQWAAGDTIYLQSCMAAAGMCICICICISVCV